MINKLNNTISLEDQQPKLHSPYAEAVLIYHWSFQLQLPDSSNEYTIIVFVLMNLFL